MKSVLTHTTLILSLSLMSIISMAAENARPENAAQRRTPPQAAIDACANKKEGDMVSFIAPRGEAVEATCKMRQVGMVAVPTHPPRERQQGMRDNKTPPAAK